jgi:hypothetical protein
MVQFTKKLYKDIGLQREVEDALPYAVVGGEWEGSHDIGMYGDNYRTVLNHIVPTGLQLKILFLKVWTERDGGRRFEIYQTNPSATGNTGSTEAYPVVGNTPSGTRDYPFLESAGSETLTGSLVDPVHVLEGSIDFRVLSESPGGAAAPDATGDRDGFVWWGVEKVPEPKR